MSSKVANDPFDLGDGSNAQDIVRAFRRSLKLEIRTMIPGSVKAYDPARNKALVSVDIQQVVRVKDLKRLPTAIAGPPRGVAPNAEVTLLPFLIPDVPVAFLASAAGFVTVPLKIGDTGLLHVCDRSIAKWLEKGLPTEPVIAGTHELEDAVFYPGLRPDTMPFTPPVDLTATVIEGTPQVKIGRLAVESITKAESLLAALITAVTASATNTTPDGGALFKANLLTQLGLIQPAQIGSIKGKVE